MSNVSARTERLNMRISPDALQTLRAAAASLQQDVSSFVLGTAVAKAREVLKDDSTIYVSKRGWDFMEDYLTNDHPVPQGLIDLFERYKPDADGNPWQPKPNADGTPWKPAPRVASKVAPTTE